MDDLSAMTEPQAARSLGINPRTLARWRKAGAVGYSLTPGGRVFYAADDLHRLRLDMRVKPTLGQTSDRVS